MNLTRYDLIRFIVIFALLAAPVLAASAQRFDHEEVTERTFQVSPGQRLTLSSDLGSVKITGGTGSTVEIRVVEGVEKGSGSLAEELFRRSDLGFSQSAEGVEVSGTYDSPGPFNRGNGLRVAHR